MHPIERLRFVARSGGAPGDQVVREAAASLAGFAGDPAALLTACRRLIDRHAANGAIWWVCARTIAAPDAADEAWRCLDALVDDPTVEELAHALPESASVLVVGWPDRLGAGFARRGDLQVRVVDVDDEGAGFVRQLERADVLGVEVPSSGLAPAVADSDLVVLEAMAVGPTCVVAEPGSWAAAAVARAAGVPVWVTVGAGRVVPSGLWGALEARLTRGAAAPWDRPVEFLPLDLVDRLVGEKGPEAVADGLRRCTTPDIAELRR